MHWSITNQQEVRGPACMQPRTRSAWLSSMICCCLPSVLAMLYKGLRGEHLAHLAHLTAERLAQLLAARNELARRQLM